MAQKITQDTTIVTTGEEIHSSVENETVILNMETQTYYTLKGTGRRIWQLIQEPRSVAEVRDILAREYDISPGRCERDLLEFLHTLQEAGLVECRR